jgi:alpha-tubulin suppressor-like RCC1 family protein
MRFICLFLAVSAFATAPYKSVGGGMHWSLVVRSDGTLWAWGDNSYGQLATGDRVNVANPQKIGTSTDWASTSPGYYHAIALKTDGTLWTWGGNGYGQIGKGTTGGYQYSPLQIGTDTWTAISGGWYHSCGIKTGGTLWCWGDGTYGAVGDGTNDNRSSPTQIMAGSTFTAVSAGGHHTVAIKSDGTLWTWGRNNFNNLHYGSLGDGTQNNRATPQQIGVATDWASVSAGYMHTMALKTNGELWVWGGDHFGELGLNNIGYQLAPVHLGSATWTAIAAKNDTSHAVKSDGTLWGWGSDAEGQLGTAAGSTSFVPVQVGSATDWGTVTRSYYFSGALRTSGEVFVWGKNDLGQLGNGGTTNVTTPINLYVQMLTAGSGKTYSTIQACADAVTAGYYCLVYPGSYAEYVVTKTNATAESSRIVFHALGTATTKGFDLRHAYITVDGFDLTGYDVNFGSVIAIYNNADYPTILNCTIRENDGTSNIKGIKFTRVSGDSANNGVFRGNTFARLRGQGFNLSGNNHLLENNTFTEMGSWDPFIVMGENHIIRGNVFGNYGTAGGGNHPDFIQTWSSSGEAAQNILIEYNFISELPEQFCQMNSSNDGVGTLATNVKDFTFRYNVIANVPANCNISMPGFVFENNTVYRNAYNMTGFLVGGSLTRGDGSGAVFKNNVLLAGGTTAATTNGINGFYSVDGFLFTREVITYEVTGESLPCPASCPNADGITTEMIANGYIDGATNGHILAAARALATINDMQLTETYAAYKQDLWDKLQESIAYDDTLKSTFSAHHNYVGGTAAAGFPARASSSCNCSATFTANKFCEAACSLGGINGGDPMLADLSNLLGADGLPFTADDGLRPLTGSPLCGAGENGVDIGAYSCGGEAPSLSPRNRFRSSGTFRGAIIK